MIREFHDVQEAVETLPDLALSYRQLERGTLRFRVGWHTVGDIAATTASLDRLVEGHGGVEPGKVLVLLCQTGHDNRFDDVPLSGGQVYLKSGDSPSGHQVIRPGYRATLLTLPARLLEAHLGEPLSARLGLGSVLEMAPGSQDAVLRLLAEAGPEPAPSRRDLSDQILAELCLGLGLEGAEGDARLDDRAHLARAIRQRLHERPDMTFTDICAELSISARTLRRVFAETYALSPGQYQLTLRLNSVRQDLKGRGGTISQVAARHGFWHMGRFSAQYRRHFGETPSQTLAGRAP